MDQEIAVATPAFELDPVTKELFLHKNNKEALKKLDMNHELIERNAAGHFWINQSLAGNLLAMKGLCIDLLQSLEQEYESTN
jgi:predicted aspartyl protease